MPKKGVIPPQFLKKGTAPATPKKGSAPTGQVPPKGGKKAG